MLSILTLLLSHGQKALIDSQALNHVRRYQLVLIFVNLLYISTQPFISLCCRLAAFAARRGEGKMPSPSFTLDAQLRFHDKWLKIDLQVCVCEGRNNMKTAAFSDKEDSMISCGLRHMYALVENTTKMTPNSIVQLLLEDKIYFIHMLLPLKNIVSLLVNLHLIHFSQNICFCDG